MSQTGFVCVVSSEITQLSLSLPAAGRVRISATGTLLSPGFTFPEIKSHTSPVIVYAEGHGLAGINDAPAAYRQKKVNPFSRHSAIPFLTRETLGWGTTPGSSSKGRPASWKRFYHFSIQSAFFNGRASVYKKDSCCALFFSSSPTRSSVSFPKNHFSTALKFKSVHFPAF